MMINLPSLKKKILRIYVNYVYLFEYLWQIQSNQKALFFFHHSVMKIFAISLFPWTVFSLSCLCPSSLSFPPFLLHVYSDGPVDTVILKNAFHFRALFFIVYVYNLAYLFIIFCFNSLNFHFTCCTLELIFLSNSHLKEWRKQQWTQHQKQIRGFLFEEELLEEFIPVNSIVSDNYYEERCV